MATYIDNIVKFHTFSKSPVSKDTTLGGAVNPSGHTVTTSQVRAQDIPAFLNTFQGTKEQAITWLGTNYPTPAHNDIVFYGGEFKAGFSTPKCLKWNAKIETPAWEDFDITAATTLKNADDKDVIAVHQNLETVFVDGSNNAATNSNRNSLFVKRADGSILDHFVASTDKIVAGMPSLGYNALVLWNGGAIDEGELDANYIGNTFAGIVHLNKQYSTGDDAKFKVTCFEYIGEKLTASLTELAKKVESVTATAGEGVQAVTDTATTAGLSVSTKTITVEGQTDPVTVKALDIDVAEVSPHGVITSGDESKLVTATDANNIATKIASDAIGGLDSSILDTAESGYLRIDIQNGKLTGGYVKIASVSNQGVVSEGTGKFFVTADDAVKIATKAASDEIADATLADGQEIATTEDTTKLVTVEDVTTYVSPLEQKVNDHLLDAAGKLEISVLADKLPKKPFFEDEVAYVNSYGFEWEKLSNNIYTNKFEVKVAQSVSGLNEFKSHTTGTVLTPSSLAAQTCKLVIYSIDDAKQLTEVAVSQPNTFDASTSIYAFKFDNQISLTSGVRYRICFRTVDGTNALHCLPVIVNSSIQGADVTKHETPTRYIIGETEDDWWGCWNTGAGQLNGVQQVVYGPKVSVSGLTPTPDEDGITLSGEKGKIYLIPNAGTENQNVYDEFVWTNNTWEKIGTTKVDLSEYVKTIKMNGSTTSPTDGQIDLGTVVTGFDSVSSVGEEGQNKTGTQTGIVRAEITNGKVQFYTKTASSTQQGISYLYDKTATELTSSTEATVTEKTVKSVYDTLANKIPTSYVSTVNGIDGAITLKAGGNDYHVIANNNTDPQSNLWGLQVNIHDEHQYIIDGFIGDTVAYGKIGSDYHNTASLPVEATKVIGNFVYGSDGKVIDTIRAERMVSDFYGKTATGLTEWVADMPNLKNGNNCFWQAQNLTTFIGDLSSLENGYYMFYECTALSEFIGDLSSLTDGYRMFSDDTAALGTQLNAESVERILESIPTYTSGEHRLGLGIHVDAVATFNEITGAQLPATKGSSLTNVSYKGWTIIVAVSPAD